MARTKLTPQLSQRICDAIRAGHSYSRASDLCGIGERTLHEWIERGEGIHQRPQTDQLAQFAHDVKAARAEREAKYIGVIEEAAHAGTWQAAAWFLERTNRRDFGRNESLEITGKDGGPVKQQVVGDEQREKVTALIDELAARRAKGAA